MLLLLRRPSIRLAKQVVARPNTTYRLYSSSSSQGSRFKVPVTPQTLAANLALFGIVYVAYESIRRHKQEELQENINRNVQSVGTPLLGGKPFTLVNQEGEPKTHTQLIPSGKYGLIYFGFTHCPDICPAELVKMKFIIDGVKKKHGFDIVPIFITCDPKRDDVQSIKHYLKDFSSKHDWINRHT